MLTGIGFEGHIMRGWRTVVFALTGVALLGATPQAALTQGLEIQPLSLDLAPQGEQLVLAALPAAGAAPVVSGALRQDFAAVPAAVRPSEQLPLPSIILGYIAPEQEEEFGLDRLLPATVEQIAFALDDLEAREALRARDPELFRRLVEEGHLDPEAAQLNRILQTELLRMRCYRSTIDGQWGRGSRRSVTSYFSQLENVSWPDQQPTNDLFRAILINGDVVCATAPRQTTQSATRTTRRTSGSSQTARPATPAPAPAPAPAKKPAVKIDPGIGIGIFR
jgi:hypothetical protein